MVYFKCKCKLNLNTLIALLVLTDFNLIKCNDPGAGVLTADLEVDSIKSTSSNQDYSLSKSFNDNNLYKINWLREDTSNENKEDHQETSSSDSKDNSIIITTTNQERYRCVLPNISRKTAKKESTDDIIDKDSYNHNPYELLLPLLTSQVCSYRLEQYWTYELCHGKYFRQFHEESTMSKPVSQEYFLGKYNMPVSDDYLKKMQNWSHEKSKSTVQIDGVQMPYIEINMTDGTLCDLNSQPRFTRVLYVCNEQSKHELYSIKETYTCEYEAIVLTPFLCLHSDFKVDSASDLDINCFAVDNSPLKPKGYLEFEIDNRSKSSENLFDVKTIIIDASGLTDRARIDLKNLQLSSQEDVEHEKRKYFAQSQSVSIDSKILKNFLTGDHCLYGGTGWWKYEFCYGLKVEQYHEEKDEKQASVLLGRWNLEAHKAWISNNPQKKPKSNKTPKYVSHYYGKGDICDVTGKPRQVEVKLKCRYTEGDQESVALYLLEPSPCDYILGIESPLICHLLSNVDEYGIMRFPDD